MSKQKAEQTGNPILDAMINASESFADEPPSATADKTRNDDPTRAKCIRIDGSTIALPFRKTYGKTHLLIEGRWFPVTGGGAGVLNCERFSFKRIYFPDDPKPNSISADKIAHTPGPWHADDYLADGKRSLAVWNDSYRYGENGHPVCLISPKEKEDQRDRANARLIAAAPQLLEACKMALDYCELNDSGSQLHLDRLVQLRAAIAKATGE